MVFSPRLDKWLWLAALGVILLLGFAPISALGLQIPQNLSSTFWLLLELVILLPIALMLQLRAIKKIRARSGCSSF